MEKPNAMHRSTLIEFLNCLVFLVVFIAAEFWPFAIKRSDTIILVPSVDVGF